ncbi:MAG: PEP-CTERM sorting domain-containing protein [Phycisphaerales bacterium JB037]
MKKLCLFGGTLVAAGLSGAASAQAEFGISYVEAARAQTYTYAFGGDEEQGFGLSGPFSFSAAYRDGSASAFASATEVRVEATDGDEIAGALASIEEMRFSVTEATVALLTWDASTPHAGGYMELRDLSTGIFLVGVNLGPTQSAGGSLNIPLNPGVMYRINFSIQAGQVLTGDSASSGFISLVVPAPSSAALLGLGGLLAARRRR